MSDLIPVAVFLAGLFIGSWLTHRARNGQSPLPSLPKRDPKPEQPKKFPEVKP